MEEDGTSPYNQWKKNRFNITNAVVPEQQKKAATGYRTKHTTIDRFIAQPLGRTGPRKPKRLNDIEPDEDAKKYFGIEAELVDERVDYTDSSGGRY